MVVFHWSWDRTVLSVNRPAGGTTSALVRQRTPPFQTGEKTRRGG